MNDKIYQILANKWRPQNFKDIIEQDHIVKAIQNILFYKNIHNSYIFYGPKGTGKTTLARLFTKGLLCMKGVTPDPCETCSNCKEIEKGNCLDFIEIDGASHTKVEEIREILSNLPYFPNQAKYKVYLIDEFHMLSKHSFNALLKTLEEPPLHIKFILSTTEINKIPSTILSRSIKFNLQIISKEAILKRLHKILLHENINFSLSALNLISVEAKGSLRDAITLTEHAILLSKNRSDKVEISSINKILGRIDPEYIFLCLKYLLSKNIIQLFNIIYFLDIKYNINWTQFFNDFFLISQKLLVINLIKHQNKKDKIIKIISEQDLILSDLQKDQLIKIAEDSQDNDLKLVYKNFMLYRNELNFNSINPRIIIERIFLNILLSIK